MFQKQLVPAHYAIFGLLLSDLFDPRMQKLRDIVFGILWIVTLKFSNESENAIFLRKTLKFRRCNLNCQADFLLI